MDKLKQFLASTPGRIVLTIVCAVVVYGLILLAVGIESTFLILLIGAVCVYYGWKALSFITPNIFLIMPIGGWLIYFLIKGIVAFFIGYIVAPFVIGKKVSDAVAASLTA